MPGTNPFEQLSLDALRRRSSIKWRAHPDDVIPLWVAEMDVLLAEPVVRAICDAAARGDTGYPAGTAYAEALSDFAAQRWSWDGLDVRRTALVPDVMMGIVEVLRLITAPGAAVVVNSPVYPPFYSFIEHMDRRIVEAPLAADARIDFVALDRAFGSAAAIGPAAFLLCNPHNPTGTVHSPGELAAVAKLAGSHRVRVVADEIHGPLVLGGARFTPYLSVPGAASGFAVLSASKAWNLAGLKAAVAVAGEDAAADLARMPEEVSHGASHVGVLAHTAALQSGREWLDTVLAGLTDNRELLGALLGQYLPAVSWTPPQATFLAWLDCTALGLTGQAPDDDARGKVSASTGPAAVFLERGRVALSSGPAFGTGGAGHVRLNFATSRAILTEVVQRMGAVAASIDR